MGNSLTVEQRTLTPSVLVRIQVPQPVKILSLFLALIDFVALAVHRIARGAVQPAAPGKCSGCGDEVDDLPHQCRRANRPSGGLKGRAGENPGLAGALGSIRF